MNTKIVTQAEPTAREAGTGATCSPAAEGGLAEGLQELRAIRARLLEISGNGYADMEGADFTEFKIAEALWANLEDAAADVAKCISEVEKALQP